MRLVCLLTVLSALAMAGCDEPNTYVAPPPPGITVAKPLVRPITDYLEFTGTTEASERVEVRARVSGVLLTVDFVPGTNVEAGQLLFSIDPREYQANLLSAEAELASAKAELERAGIELGRAERLFKKSAGSESEVVRWKGEQAVARAAVQRAEAAIARAKLDLSYTEVTAPIAGRVGRNLVDVGNLVGQGEATLLTDIVRYDPMYAYFNLNERDMLRAVDLYRAQVKAKGVDPSVEPSSRAEIPLELGLVNEKGYPHVGVMDYAESGLDPQTGTLRMRGAFPNGDSPPRLFPGLFTKIRMPMAKRSDVTVVSDRAIGSDQTGLYVLVVGPDDEVEKRNVVIGQLTDGMRVIEDGVGAEDRIVVNGLQRARPGAKVTPAEVDMAGFATSARSKAAQESAPASEPAEPASEPSVDPPVEKSG